MDASSVAAWRCPNCKICEISGDAPHDETKMLFCEMCDRGFSLDLLTPPLNSAPSGLWICGQCVDCHNCRNSLEPNGPSLTHWSRNPNLCYRCSGCSGLPELEKYLNKRQCPVCSGYWRDDDADLATCHGCDVKVHARCDSTANSYINSRCGTSSENLQYYCLSCRKKRSLNKEDGQVTRSDMAYLVTQSILQNSILISDNSGICKSELQQKLIEQIDWRTRELWRDEYKQVVFEGVRFLNLAREQFGDPRYLMERFLHENEDLPKWMGYRASRFLRFYSNKFKHDPVEFAKQRIECCVVTAKLASSWVKVACRMMGMNPKKIVKVSITKLLIPPHPSGTLALPLDQVRYEKNKTIISKDEWLKSHEIKLRLYIHSVVFPMSTELVQELETGQLTKDAKKDVKIRYKVAEPLCGWPNHIFEREDVRYKWSDPRECCLCHLCGDDDAGIPIEIREQTIDPTQPKIPRLGRLLPLTDGDWVHSSCALWSSETWQSSGGLLHAMEKARSRGSQLRCFGCGRPGATVGCVKTNCPCNYHFPCAFACGAVFTSSKEMFCKNHKNCAEDFIKNPGSEPMETLIIAQDKSKIVAEKDDDGTYSLLCVRYGALLLHQLGEIDQNSDFFHSKDYVTPVGYTATRIFWSTVNPKERTVYVLKIEKSPTGKPLFSIIPGDDPLKRIERSSAENAYNDLISRIHAINSAEFSSDVLYSKKPTMRQSSKQVFGLNAPQFFGFGVDQIRKLIEVLPGVEAVAAKLSEKSQQYLFCFSQPSIDSITELQRQRAALLAEKILENPCGCARVEGMKAVAVSCGQGRITRALVRNLDDNDGVGWGNGTGPKTEKIKADKYRIQRMYNELKKIPIEQRLTPRRSHIHGWGLFSKVDLPKDSMIVEYMGEIIHKCIADIRETSYEISGEGSCYMFRLDLQRIVDATKIGCMARFMNHCCQPNAYAKIVSVDTNQGRQENKIIVFSLSDIKVGEEITYDYKFPVEDGSLRCTCGAENCIGRLN